MKFTKVMFSQVSVCPNGGCTCPAGKCTCLGVGSGQVPLPQVGTPPWAFTHPLCRYTPPGRYTSLGRYPLGRYLPGRYTPEAGTPWAGLPQAGTSSHSACWDTVNKWVICIPLECILVSRIFKLQVQGICG